MIMSQQLKPRLTWSGIVLASALIAGSWFAGPSFACSSDESETLPRAQPTVQPPSAPTPPTATLVSDRSETKKQHAQQKLKSLFKDLESLKSEDLSLEQRLSIIEKKMDAMLKLLEQRLAGLDTDAQNQTDRQGRATRHRRGAREDEPTGGSCRTRHDG